MFRITRIYSDGNGDSHIEDISMELKDAGIIGKLSDPLPANGVIFREAAPSYDYDFHTAPQRQYIILLDGAIEIETSLGDERTCKAGEVLLVEDTTGKGHRTRNLQPMSRRSVFITLPQ